MKLVASLIIHNERKRYLEECIAHLVDFCDEVAIINDGSTDGTTDFLWSYAHKDSRVHSCNTEARFFKHEGTARQWLVDWTLLRKPTHVLSIDADELVDDGPALRARLEAELDVPVWSLNIEEVWNANDLGLGIRQDGGWRAHPLACCWKVLSGTTYKMLDRRLACRRVPTAVWQATAKPSGVSLLHFGWTRKEERQARYDRYATHDGGRFHAGTHLRSILWEDARVKLQPRPWPVGPVFDGLRERLTGDTVSA